MVSATLTPALTFNKAKLETLPELYLNLNLKLHYYREEES